MSSPYRRLAIRAYTERQRKPRGARPPRGSKRRPVLLLDCETRIDAAQALLFGTWRYCRPRTDGSLHCLQEGIFHAADLLARELDVLGAYTASHDADVGEGGDPELKLLSIEDFLRTVLYPATYRAKAAIVGFNLPFDLSRLAWECSAGRRSFHNGFSLTLFSYEDDNGKPAESGYRPRLLIKTLDAKRHLMRWSSAREREEVGDPGPLLDLRTLVFALTDRSHSLASACEAFAVEHGKQHAEEHGVLTETYVEYNRADVRATAGLYEQVMREFVRHPIDVAAEHVYSPAGIGRAYLRGMGITPILERQPDFPRLWLGRAMTAYYGGRTECRIRRTPVPVVACDFVSMYPTVCALMGIWKMLIAERVEIRDVTDELRALLDTLTAETLLDPEQWPHFVGLVKVQPAGETLPARAPYADGKDSYTIGLNPLSSDEALWYTIPDVLAATLRTGRPPEILEAVRFVPCGQQDDLDPIRLRGDIEIDPRQQDFFTTVIEERKRLPARTDLPEHERARLGQFLKTLANSSAYGIYAQMDRQPLPATKRETVHVHALDDQPFSAQVSAPEQPGEFTFPPIAACITGAARLLLGLTEHLVGQAGGQHAYMDTDSIFIVATRQGGLVPCPGGPHTTPAGTEAILALSFEQVEQIVAQLARLNPYASDAVPGSILEIEDENFDADGHQREIQCFAIAAKRYALYQDTPSGRDLLKVSEHGLGHLLNPTAADAPDRNWIRQFWTYLLTVALGEAAEEPAWLDLPAVGQLTIGQPAVLSAFEHHNRERPYAAQIKPFNFMLTAHPNAFGQPTGTDPDHFHPVAPYSSEPSEWLIQPWSDRRTGERVQVRTGGGPGGPGRAEVLSYRQLAQRYAVHREAKSLAPDGQPCRRDTAGLLRPQPITGTRIVFIGKESNALEARHAGTIHDQHEVLSQYDSPHRDPWPTLIRPVLRHAGATEVARRANMSRSQVKDLLAGRARRPHAGNLARLKRVAGDLASERLHRVLQPAPLDALDACYASLRINGESSSSGP